MPCSSVKPCLPLSSYCSPYEGQCTESRCHKGDILRMIASIRSIAFDVGGASTFIICSLFKLLTGGIGSSISSQSRYVYALVLHHSAPSAAWLLYSMPSCPGNYAITTLPSTFSRPCSSSYSHHSNLAPRSGRCCTQQESPKTEVAASSTSPSVSSSECSSMCCCLCTCMLAVEQW